MAPAAAGRISVPRLPAAPHRRRRLRRPRHAGRHARPPIKKTSCGACGLVHAGWYDRKTRRVRDLSCGDVRVHLDLEVRRVDCRACGTVRQERLPWPADHPFYTKRFAFFVGRRCRESTVHALAKELRLDWEAVKRLDVHST